MAPLALADPPDWVVLLGAGGTGGALRFLEPEALELLGTCPMECRTLRYIICKVVKHQCNKLYFLL